MIGKMLVLIVGVAAVVVMTAAMFELAPDDGDDATDVIILMGQSNAKYRPDSAIPSEASPVPEPGRAWYFGTEAQPTGFTVPLSECGVWPMSDANGSRIGDKWPSMAATYTEITGRSVAMLYLAEGGKSITTFDPTGSEGYLWQKSRPMAEGAMKAFEDAGLKIGRVSVVWIQGESDKTMDPAEYQARMLKLFETILNGGLGVSVDGPIWICKTRTATAPGPAAAELQFCKDHPGIARIASEAADGFTQANGLMWDTYHYTQEGNNIIGSSVGMTMANGVMDASKNTSKLWLLIGVVPVVVIAALLVAIVSRN